MPRPHQRLITAFVVVLLTSGAAMPHAQQPSLRQVLQRLDAYLESYESLLETLVADERYEQRVESRFRNARVDPLSRTLRSDYALARSPGGHAWTGFRDTYEVDGAPVRDREDRLAALLADGSAASARQALRISRENARFNLGEEIVARTINVPTVALDLIHPRLRWRFSIDRRGEETLLGVRAWVLAFRESSRATILRTPDGKDRASRLAVWVDPGTGAVLRTDLTWTGAPEGFIAVHYRHDERIGALVPEMMLEEYRGTRGLVTGEATYTNYRRFSTSARIVPDVVQ